MRIGSGAMGQAAFWGLCLLAGSGWLVGLLNPAVAHPLMHLGLESLSVAGVFGWFGRRDFAGVRGLAIALWGTVLVFPAVLSAWAGVALSPVTLALVFTLVPVITVLVAGQTMTQFGLGESPMRLLLPALAGVGGAAMLLPFSIPQEAAGWLWLGAAVAAAITTGVALVRLQRLLRGVAIASATSSVCAGWTVVCLALGWVGQGLNGPSMPQVLALDLQQAAISAALVVLTVVLLGSWTPARFSARYLATPLVTVLEGVVLVRPRVNWTMCVGVGALGLAVAVLLRPDHADSSESSTG